MKTKIRSVLSPLKLAKQVAISQCHSENTAAYTAILCDYIEKHKLYDMPHEFFERVKMAGYLHDIGKNTTPPHILNKPKKLTADEAVQMRAHTIDGLAEFGTFSQYFTPETAEVIKDVILSHHERIDGTGYPFGLKGDDIPLAARIVAIADVFDALTESRVYRKGLSIEQAVNIMKKDGLDKYDPVLFEAFLAVLPQFVQHKSTQHHTRSDGFPPLSHPAASIFCSILRDNAKIANYEASDISQYVFRYGPNTVFVGSIQNPAEISKLVDEDIDYMVRYPDNTIRLFAQSDAMKRVISEFGDTIPSDQSFVAYSMYVIESCKQQVYQEGHARFLEISGDTSFENIQAILDCMSEPDFTLFVIQKTEDAVIIYQRDNNISNNLSSQYNMTWKNGISIFIFPDSTEAAAFLDDAKEETEQEFGESPV